MLEEQKAGGFTSQFQNLLKNYSNQDSVVLVQDKQRDHQKFQSSETLQFSVNRFQQVYQKNEWEKNSPFNKWCGDNWIFMQMNETVSLLLTMYKNQFETDQRTKM